MVSSGPILLEVVISLGIGGGYIGIHVYLVYKGSQKWSNPVILAETPNKRYFGTSYLVVI